MHIICSKQSLIENLNVVTKFTSTRAIVPILECVLVDATFSSKNFKLLATDLEMGIETKPIECEVIERGSIAINSKSFYDIIKHFPKEANIIIKSVDKNLVEISFDNYKFKMKIYNYIDFPSQLEVEERKKFKINSNTLGNMIRQTVFSVSNEETKPMLTGELLEIKNGFLNIVAIDGFRISYKQTETEYSDENFKVIVPAKTMSELSKIISMTNEDVFFHFTDKNILFETSKFFITSRLIKGDYIKYDAIFREDYKIVARVNKKTILDAIKKINSVIKKEKKKMIKLNIVEDKIIISSNIEIGEFEINVPSKNEFENVGEWLKIYFNPKYLIDALNSITGDEVELLFKDKLDYCIIKKDINKTELYYILPLKLN